MDSDRECRPRTAGKFSLLEEPRGVIRLLSVVIWVLLANNLSHDPVGRSVRISG